MSLSRVATGLPWMRGGPGSDWASTLTAPHGPSTPPPRSEAAMPPCPTVAMKSRRVRVRSRVGIVIPPRGSALVPPEHLAEHDEGDGGRDDQGGDGIQLRAHHRAQHRPDLDGQRVVVADGEQRPDELVEG